MRYSLFVVLGILVLVAGCAPQTQSSSSQLTGTQGITLEVIQEPDQIFMGEEFQITYQLENNGAAAVSEDNPGVITFSSDSLYTEFVDITSTFPDGYFWLAPREQYAAGEATFVSAFFNARDIDRNSAQVSTSVVASMCYPYESTVTSEVCIERSRVADPGSISCRSQPISPASPAGPLGVDLIETRQNRAEDGTIRPSFRMQIRNYQDGLPSATDCSSNDLEYNQVLINAQLLDQELECLSAEGDGRIRFTRGVARVVCTVPQTSTLTFAGSQANYISLLTVNLTYTYRDSVRTDIDILR